jgi:hypothetical protein
MNSDGAEISAHRACVATMTTFIDLRINSKELKVLGRNLPKEADDVEFYKVLKEITEDDGFKATNEQLRMAVASYCATLGVTPDGEPVDTEGYYVKDEDEGKTEDEDEGKTEDENKDEDEGKTEDENKDEDEGKPKTKKKLKERSN